MARKQAPGQMVLDLFAPCRGTLPEDVMLRWCAWLHDTHGCTDAVDPIVRDLVSAFGRHHGLERSKVLPCLDGRRRALGWTLADMNVLGLFDGTIDYHVVWDRRWAVRCGLPRDVVRRVHRCEDYMGHPRFYDGRGDLVCRCDESPLRPKVSKN